MQRKIGTLVFLLTVNFIVMAQKGFELEKEIVINVPAAELWEMIGPGFEEVYKWSSNVDHSEGSGTSMFEGATCSERACNVNVKGFNKIKETLTMYDQEKRALAYEVNEGMPGFVTRAANQWTVVALSEYQSKLVMNAAFESKGLMGTLMRGMMKSKMSKTLDTVLEDAKVYAETGQISSAKEKRIAQLERKAA